MTSLLFVSLMGTGGGGGGGGSRLHGPQLRRRARWAAVRSDTV